MKNVLSFVALSVVALTIYGQENRGAQPEQTKGSFSVVEATIPEMRAAMAEGRVTARELALLPSLQITGTPTNRDSQVLTPPFCGNGSSDISMSANLARCSVCDDDPRQVTGQLCPSLSRWASIGRSACYSVSSDA